MSRIFVIINGYTPEEALDSIGRHGSPVVSNGTHAVCFLHSPAREMVYGIAEITKCPEGNDEPAT